MARSSLHSRAARLVVPVALAAWLGISPAAAEPLAMVGILEGSATLVRQTTRHALAEGVALDDGDIVETPADGFLQIEFGDGAIVGVGGNTRLILKPRLTSLKPANAPRLYLLEGWLKIGPPPKGQAFAAMSPPLEFDTTDASMVLRVAPKAYALFVETGNARLLPREGDRSAIGLKAGDFAAKPATADKPSVGARLEPTFIEQMPRNFRDRLPARAALYAKRPVAPKALAPVDYGDVKGWIQSEPGIRLALSRQWRTRASDRAFRDELAANLPAHMEWERVLYPERFRPKPPQPRPLPPESAPSAPFGPTN